ncbi:MAG: response regulator [Candidatus Accumulibacter sp.]|uniref:response regulator n=1 Tax=Accumulibacter sp. TaxID=2053492 RepID=UPI00287A2E36|nr:response regulator [Accumulibacter sp.]MDS4013593.1 response regulator [Accumulibacter sp.]
MAKDLTARERAVLILLVEDEPADAHLVRLALRENRVPAEVAHVVDGREALAYLRREGPSFVGTERPDLILLDLNMPRMDGFEFLAAVKRDPGLRGIPVVVLSTSEAERDVRSAYRLGAAGYVAKSSSVNDLIVAFGRLSRYWLTLARLPARGK